MILPCNDPKWYRKVSRSLDIYQSTLYTPLPTQSIYHVSYLRGLLPDHVFQGVDLQHLDGEGDLIWLLVCSGRYTPHHQRARQHFPLYNATLDAQLFTGMNLKMLLPPPEDPSQAMKPGSEVSPTQEAQRLAAWVENGALECPEGSRIGHARALQTGWLAYFTRHCTTPHRHGRCTGEGLPSQVPVWICC